MISRRRFCFGLAALSQYGAERREFEVEGGRAFVILPAAHARGRPWVWYAPTFIGRLPSERHSWLFRQALAAGFSIAGADAAESYGSPRGTALYTRAYRALRSRYRLSARPVLLAQSRGGLMLLNWAAENASRVSRIAGIYPVCDLRSYPGLAKAASAYGLDEAGLSARLSSVNPIDRLAPLAARRVPVFLIHGDSDRVVPIEVNSAELARRYRALGGAAILKVVPGKGHQEVPEFFESPDLLRFLLDGSTE